MYCFVMTIEYHLVLVTLVVENHYKTIIDVIDRS